MCGHGVGHHCLLFDLPGRSEERTVEPEGAPLSVWVTYSATRILRAEGKGVWEGSRDLRGRELVLISLAQPTE